MLLCGEVENKMRGDEKRVVELAVGLKCKYESTNSSTIYCQDENSKEVFLPLLDAELSIVFVVNNCVHMRKATYHLFNFVLEKMIGNDERKNSAAFCQRFPNNNICAPVCNIFM